MPAAKYVGVDNKFTFLLWDPVSERMGEYDPRSNPYVILNRAIRDAVDEGEAILGRHRLNISKWAPLVSDRSKKKAFSSVTKLYYSQGLIYQHRDEIFVKDGQPPKGARENDLPQIIQVSKTGGEDLANLLNETHEGFTGDTDNHAEYYVYGETVDLVDGSFITFYNPEKHNLDTEVIDATDDDNIEEENEVEVAGNSREFKGWKAQVDREFFYVNKRRRRKCKADITKYAKSIGKNLQWWDDVLHIPTHDEICMYLANGFRSIPNLIRYGWADHPEFFTDEVKGLLANRTQGQGAEVPTDEGTESSAIPDDELDSFDDNELDDQVASEEFDDSDYEGTDDDADAVEVVEELADGTVVEDEVEEISGDDDDAFEEDVVEAEEEIEEVEDVVDDVEVEEVVEDLAADKARKAAEARSAARSSSKKPTPKKK